MTERDDSNGIGEKNMHSINSKSVEEVVIGMNIGHQIQHLRKVKGLTQKQLAEEIGTAQSAIARVERDNYLPSISFLIRVANALGKRVEVRMK